MIGQLIAALIVLAVGEIASAQTLDDLTLQIHGFATQSFIYSSSNNWNTVDTSDGSAAWTETVVNLSAQPSSRLRIGVQARYLLLGTLNNAINLDWADADYKIDEFFGFRFGKVKSPAGLLNETQDIDPAHLWILLPPSIYSIASRNSVLAHYGGVAYGSVPLGSSFGKLSYDAYGGQRVIGTNDGLFQPFRDKGIVFTPGPTIVILKDQRAFYAMASYKVAPRLTGGLYYSSSLDRKLPVGGTGYQKDWALSARYDFTPFVYLKFEQHIMDGTELGYSVLDNTGGPRPNSRMTPLKLGVSF